MQWMREQLQPHWHGARFRQKFTPEDALGSHACSLEASMRVTNGIPLGCSLLLPYDAPVFSVQTLKARAAAAPKWRMVVPATSSGAGVAGRGLHSAVDSAAATAAVGGEGMQVTAAVGSDGAAATAPADDSEEVLGELLSRLTIGSETKTHMQSVEVQQAMHKRMSLHKAKQRPGGTIMLNMVEAVQLHRTHTAKMAAYAAERALKFGGWGLEEPLGGGGGGAADGDGRGAGRSRNITSASTGMKLTLDDMMPHGYDSGAGAGAGTGGTEGDYVTDLGGGGGEDEVMSDID
jgi:hypothetical protein